MLEFTLDTEHPVSIPCEKVKLEGLLHIPKGVRGIVLFAHGSGSSRLSSRNQHVAAVLQKAKFATLLFDLLTPEEEAVDVNTGIYRFDITFLAERLTSATHWVTHNPVLKKLPIGYFGASTGGGAALVAAARLADQIKAVVSRGGRPDMAQESLAYVEAPTLLIVGGNDEPVIVMNETAMQQMHCTKELMIIPGATHLFEEAGKLDEVAKLAKDWFEKYL
jgi:putative phosphoribosyl transferase